MTVVHQMLERYPLDTDATRYLALREVMQEIALAGLNRGANIVMAGALGTVSKGCHF